MKKISIAMVVAGLVVLAGIFWYVANSKPKQPQPDSSQSMTNTPGQDQVLDIVVNYDPAKNFTAQTYQAEQGQKVSLKVTSDIADELHFHGYDLHTDLESGKQGEIDFTADKTGRFEFELEDHNTTLGVIEVYPQ